MKNYYRILDITYDASASVVKSAYKKLVLRYHPDVSKHPNAEERFKEIAEAYHTLSDTYKRFMYDKEFKPKAFYTRSAEEFKEDDSDQADFMKKPSDPTIAERIKEVFSKIQINFVFPSLDSFSSFFKNAQPRKGTRSAKRNVKVDPLLKRMREVELYDRLMNSTNFYVQLNALYALSLKKSSEATHYLKTAFGAMRNPRLKVEILKQMTPAGADKAFFAALEQEVSCAENDLAKEIILYLVEAGTRESKRILHTLRSSQNEFIRQTVNTFYAKRA